MPGLYQVRAACDSNSATITIYVVKVIIKKDGIDITNLTLNEIVGRQVNLQVDTIPSGLSLSQISWTIPGYIISNYAPNVQTGTVFPFLLSFLTLPNVIFYWVDGTLNGTQQTVQVSCTIQNKLSSSGATNFLVMRPQGVLNATITGQVVVNILDGGWKLHFGDGTARGISFSRSVTFPAGFGGTLEWIQLANPVIRRRRRISDGVWEQLLGGTGLDTAYPYLQDPNGNTDDSPLQSLPGPATSPYSEVTANDTFAMYLMFKPNGTNTIWVPLRVRSWGWSGDTLRNPSAWTGGGSPQTLGPDSDTTTHPTWTRNVAFDANGNPYNWQ